MCNFSWYRGVSPFICYYLLGVFAQSIIPLKKKQTQNPNKPKKTLRFGPIENGQKTLPDPVSKFLYDPVSQLMIQWGNEKMHYTTNLSYIHLHLQYASLIP